MNILIPDFLDVEIPDTEREVAGDGAAIVTLRERVPDRVGDEIWRAADAVISWGYMRIDGAAVARMSRCRAIVAAMVGYDHIDIAAAGARGIAVCNVPDYGTTEIADHAIALMLALRRGIASFQDALRADPRGGWRFDAAPLIGRSRGKRFGVVGLGAIGTAAALRARALGMSVSFHDPFARPGLDLALGFERRHDLDELLAEADVVSLHTLLTESTRGLIGRAALARMKPGAFLINTARGAIVDLDALHDALREGRLGGAGLDVLPIEPPDPDHPLIAAWRRREPWLDGRLLITPHAAFYSAEGIVDLRRKSIEAAVAMVRHGRPINCVNQHLMPTA